MCLNFDRAFETGLCEDEGYADLGTDLDRLDGICDGEQVGLRRRAASLPGSGHPRNDAAGARRARLGCRYGQGPTCRRTRPVRGAQDGNHTERCRHRIGAARPVFRSWPRKQLRRCPMMHARRCSLAATLLQFLGNSVRTVLALSFVMLAIALAPGVPTVLATGRTST